VYRRPIFDFLWREFQQTPSLKIRNVSFHAITLEPDASRVPSLREYSTMYLDSDLQINPRKIESPLSRCIEFVFANWRRYPGMDHGRRQCRFQSGSAARAIIFRHLRPVFLQCRQP
jgi:hypothetical protein